MLSSLKTRPMPHGSRTVPNGGLGGCVVISPTHSSSESVWSGSRSYQYSKRLASSRLYDTAETRHAGNALRLRLDAPLPATPVTPLYPQDLSVTIAGEVSPYEWSSERNWPLNGETKWSNDNSTMDTFTSSERKQSLMPVELPGSLLLPSQGFEQTNPPSTPPRPFRQFRRVNDSKSSFETVPSLTNSCESSPESGSFSPSSLRSHLQKKLPALPSVNDRILRDLTPSPPVDYTTTRSVPTQSQPFASMNAQELLQLLPDLYEEETATRWMTAMQRELSHLRDWTNEQATTATAARRVTHLETMNNYFSEELKGPLHTARQICQSHDATFQRVQESFDRNRQTHGVKLAQIETDIRDALGRLQDRQFPRAQVFSEHEEVTVLLLFRRSIDTLSKFIQSQLVYQLRQQERGLSRELAGLLRTFDDNHRADRRQVLVDGEEGRGCGESDALQPHPQSPPLQPPSPPPPPTTTTTTAAATEWVQFGDLEVKLQRTQQMLREAQRTLIFSHDELRNTSRNCDGAIGLVTRYQAKLDGYHKQADVIRKKLVTQHESEHERDQEHGYGSDRVGTTTSDCNSSNNYYYYHHHNDHNNSNSNSNSNSNGNCNYLSHIHIPRSRMTWDHHHHHHYHHPTTAKRPPSTLRTCIPTVSATVFTTNPSTNRCSMGPKMQEIHTGIDDLINRLHSQTHQITSLSDQVAHLRVDNAVLNRQNTSLSQEIYAQHHAATANATVGGETGDKRFHQGAYHFAEVTGKAKGRMRQLKLKLHGGIRKSV